jgi:hypothetical protein
MRFEAIVVCAMLCSSCSELPIGCDRVGDSPAKAEQLAIRMVVARSQASDDSNLIKYRDERHFRLANPDCCSTEVAGTSPFEFDSGQVTLLYRRQVNGAEPFYVQHVAVGPCVHWQEESGRSLSPNMFALDRKNSAQRS